MKDAYGQVKSDYKVVRDEVRAAGRSVRDDFRAVGRDVKEAAESCKKYDSVNDWLDEK
jgi:hypothetical protein